MSSRYDKISYNEEGDWGSVNVRTLYCHHHNTCDITSFYDDKGNWIFSYEDTLDGNIFYKMIELITKWKDNPNVESVGYEEWKELMNKGNTANGS